MARRTDTESFAETIKPRYDYELLNGCHSEPRRGEESHKLFCDYNSEVSIDSGADFVEFFLLLKEDELVVGVGA